MTNYKVSFIRKVCLAEIQVQANSKEEAEKKAYKKLHKFDQDYDISEIDEVDEADFEETATIYPSEFI